MKFRQSCEFILTLFSGHQLIGFVGILPKQILILCAGMLTKQRREGFDGITEGGFAVRYTKGFFLHSVALRLSYTLSFLATSQDAFIGSL